MIRTYDFNIDMVFTLQVQGLIFPREARGDQTQPGLLCEMVNIYNSIKTNLYRLNNLLTEEIYINIYILKWEEGISRCIRKPFPPAWQVIHISRSGHILDIKVLPAICQLPGVDVVNEGGEGVRVHCVDVDLSLHLPSLQPSSEDWRLGAEEIFMNSKFL